jgi:hypothetical protein
MFYDRLGLFEWRSKSDSIKLFIYESDPNGHMPNLFGRNHDPVFCGVVKRSEEKPQIYMSKIPASSSAINWAKYRSTLWLEKVKSLWNRGLVKGIPSMFIELETVNGGANTNNDRKPKRDRRRSNIR